MLVIESNEIPLTRPTHSSLYFFRLQIPNIWETFNFTLHLLTIIRILDAASMSHVFSEQPIYEVNAHS